MRLVPRHWHNETWVCSLRGHVAPGAWAARLRPEDAALAVDAGDGTAFVRCLRCDMWARRPRPAAAEARYEVIPPVTTLVLPRRGKPLEDAILLRVIAVDRAVHAVLFGALALALLVVKVELPAIHTWAESVLRGLNTVVGESAPAGSHRFLTGRLESLLTLKPGDLTVLLVTSTAYAVVEGIEAVFLWKERRWAEYLTVVATIGLIPFEVHELVDRVTVLRVAALVVNVAIVAWLVWTKHLFGVRGGAGSLQETTDWAAVLASPVTAGVAAHPDAAVTHVRRADAVTGQDGT